MPEPIPVLPDPRAAQGAFGCVYRARWNGKDVAAKKLHRNRLGDAELRAVTRSAGVQLELPPHPCLVQLLGVSWSIDSASVLLVMELCAAGSLGAALSSASTAHLDWATQKLPIARDIAHGLSFLHAQLPPIIHRDLKPDNIMLTAGRAGCKIGDFDSLRLIGHSLMTREVRPPLHITLGGTWHPPLPLGRVPHSHPTPLGGTHDVLSSRREHQCPPR